MSDQAEPAKPTPGLAQSLLGFDTLFGPALVRIIYYLGLLGIALIVLLGMLGAFVMGGVHPLFAVAITAVALVAGAVLVIVWRCLCELALVQFLIHARLSALKP